MKRLLLISATVMISVSSFAQTACTMSTDNTLFKFDNPGTPKEIYKLGTSPEFPFLRNMSSPRQVYAAIKKNDQEKTAGMYHLNDILMAIGFSNGASDVNESDITDYYIPPGTEGNMGSGDYNTAYYKLAGNASMFKAWKISSPTGCYVYILAKCGNAFYPNIASKTACVTAPVTLTGDTAVTLNGSAQQVTTTSNVYVYYAMKHRKHKTAHPIPEVADAYPSTPLLLRSTNDVESIPDTYRVSVITPNNTVYVCPDSTLNLTTNINVEKTSAYAGYYPNNTKKEYKKISKRAYKRIARKMRKADRKEARVAKLSGVKVNVNS